MSFRTIRRRWDEYDCYLFDIDGTLLHCADAVHYFAFCAALQSLAGCPLNLDGVTAHGNTDIGILRDSLALANVPEQLWRPRISETCTAMCHFVEEHKHEICATVLPFVFETLHHLHRRGAVLGVATGNLEGIGRLKLQHCGLLEQVDFAGYSDEFEYRSDVFQHALAKARAIAGEDATVCVIGDTPADVQAARANCLDVIAVATGIYPYEQLVTAQPDLCLQSLAELFSSTTTS
jgi:phosphoglycolate phosphatase-like HAD superfamily hydrolase